VHERACLTVMLDGVMAERINGRERYCERASVLIKPGAERHDDTFGPDGSEQIIVEPLEHGLELLETPSSLFASVRFFRDANAESLARRLARELDHADDVSPLAIAALTFELFVDIARRGARDRPTGHPPPAWLRRTHDFLMDGVGKVPTLTELAGEAGVHPAHLARAFRAHYGCAVGTFVRRRRIEAAAHDLETTSATIAGIAVLHGFVDQSHFTRQFRRQLGMTPREYRQRVQSR
jgi:AraC family transcriptional regulator